jgi:hypothetical protein
MNYKTSLMITLDDAYEWWQNYCNAPKYRQEKELLNFGEYVDVIKSCEIIIV